MQIFSVKLINQLVEKPSTDMHPWLSCRDSGVGAALPEILQWNLFERAKFLNGRRLLRRVRRLVFLPSAVEKVQRFIRPTVLFVARMANCPLADSLKSFFVRSALHRMTRGK